MLLSLCYESTHPATPVCLESPELEKGAPRPVSTLYSKGSLGQSGVSSFPHGTCYETVAWGAVSELRSCFN